MKLAIITDTHWGARGDDRAFSRYFQRFYDRVFFPTLRDRGISTVMHLGDLVDRRKYINFQTLSDIRRYFIEPCIYDELHLELVVGNHDCHYKNTNDLNAVQELFGSYPITIHTEAAEVHLGDLKVLLIPWICDENRASTERLIGETDAQVIMGHLEIRGFEMYRGIVSNSGESDSVFSKFDMVLSGHFHHRSSRGNIHYLGSPYELIWSDFDDPRGFYIFDSEKRGLEFIQNPYRMHRKVFYEDEDKRLAEVVEERDFADLEDCVVKVIVKSKTNPYWFDLFMTKIEESGPASLQIVEDHHNDDMLVADDVIREAEDTLTIFRKSIDQMEGDTVDKPRLERFMGELYGEALRV